MIPIKADDGKGGVGSTRASGDDPEDVFLYVLDSWFYPRKRG